LMEFLTSLSVISGVLCRKNKIEKQLSICSMQIVNTLSYNYLILI
jgi:hypothetical protein